MKTWLSDRHSLLVFLFHVFQPKFKGNFTQAYLAPANCGVFGASVQPSIQRPSCMVLVSYMHSSSVYSIPWLKQLILQRPVSNDSEPEPKRVTPSELQAHHLMHQFHSPSCMCAYDAPGIEYIKSALFRVIGGNFTGEYVAACATNSCNYLSESSELLSRFIYFL